MSLLLDAVIDQISCKCVMNTRRYTRNISFCTILYLMHRMYINVDNALYSSLLSRPHFVNKLFSY